MYNDLQRRNKSNLTQRWRYTSTPSYVSVAWYLINLAQEKTLPHWKQVLYLYYMFYNLDLGL
jgi:hypothetical protein